MDTPYKAHEHEADDPGVSKGATELH